MNWPQKTTSLTVIYMYGHKYKITKEHVTGLRQSPYLTEVTKRYLIVKL